MIVAIVTYLALSVAVPLVFDCKHNDDTQKSLYEPIIFVILFNVSIISCPFNDIFTSFSILLNS